MRNHESHSTPVTLSPMGASPIGLGEHAKDTWTLTSLNKYDPWSPLNSCSEPFKAMGQAVPGHSSLGAPSTRGVSSL